jgi:hypothetical protein
LFLQIFDLVLEALDFFVKGLLTLFGSLFCRLCILLGFIQASFQLLDLLV